MQLTVLLEEAREAGPDRRIMWRDPIAAFGERAIAGVQGWLADPVLAAFAIRVIQRVGEQGHIDEAAQALRGARRVVPPNLQGDLVWAIGRLRALKHPTPERSAKTAVSAPVRTVRERPLFSTVARRRSR